MTLYVKGTNNKIVGVLGTTYAVVVVKRLDSDGYPVFGVVGASTDLDDVNMLNENGLLTFVDENDGEYPPSAIVDLDDVTGVETPCNGGLAAPARPVTEIARATWRVMVAHGKTMNGLQDWAMSLSDRQWLAMHGKILRERDWLIAREVSGAFQVTDEYPTGTVTETLKETDFFCVIGDSEEDVVRRGLDRIAEVFKTL